MTIGCRNEMVIHKVKIQVVVEDAETEYFVTIKKEMVRFWWKWKKKHWNRYDAHAEHFASPPRRHKVSKNMSGVFNTRKHLIRPHMVNLIVGSTNSISSKYSGARDAKGLSSKFLKRKDAVSWSRRTERANDTWTMQETLTIVSKGEKTGSYSRSRVVCMPSLFVILSEQPTITFWTSKQLP